MWGRLINKWRRRKPTICTGCAAAALWRHGHEQRYHPLADGPLTGDELALIVLFRAAVNRAKTAQTEKG
jgi:hypothetical protein